VRTDVKQRRQRAQALVEFALIVPIIMMMALSIAEFGVAYGTNMTLIEATREGARVGAVLRDGSTSFGCPGYPGAANVDPQIILAVQRVVESPGSGITLANIDSVIIYKSNGSGGPVASNQWAVGNGPTVCGAHLDFAPGGVGWAASTRSAVLPSDSLGVMIRYRYRLFTPLSSLAGLFGAGTITMVDSTVFDLEP
jgi:hypothetical protein